MCCASRPVELKHEFDLFLSTLVFGQATAATSFALERDLQSALCLHCLSCGSRATHRSVQERQTLASLFPHLHFDVACE